MDTCVEELPLLTQELLIAESIKIPSQGLEWLLKRSNPRNAKAVHHIRERANEFSISLGAALDMRQRFLEAERLLWLLYLEEAAEPIGSLPYGSLSRIEAELDAIAGARAPFVSTIPDKVTNEMIARAKEYPIDQLIEFIHGKAHCFAHDDKVASMFHGTKTNQAVCPSGCGKSFNAIDVLMLRDSYSFLDAVRKLCS